LLFFFRFRPVSPSTVRFLHYCFFPTWASFDLPGSAKTPPAVQRTRQQNKKHSEKFAFPSRVPAPKLFLA
jgi:hypothetical protein